MIRRFEIRVTVEAHALRSNCSRSCQSAVGHDRDDARDGLPVVEPAPVKADAHRRLARIASR